VFTEQSGNKERRYQLYRSAADPWDAPGALLHSAVDYENGIVFSDKLPKDFDYEQFAILNLFLNLIKRSDAALMGTYTVIDATANICKI